LDLIASRTIDENPRLKESKSDRKRSKVDWHIWLYKDLGNVADYGLLVEEKSNWCTAFRGGAWIETGNDTEERKKKKTIYICSQRSSPTRTGKALK